MSRSSAWMTSSKHLRMLIKGGNNKGLWNIQLQEPHHFGKICSSPIQLICAPKPPGKFHEALMFSTGKTTVPFKPLKDMVQLIQSHHHEGHLYHLFAGCIGPWFGHLIDLIKREQHGVISRLRWDWKSNTPKFSIAPMGLMYNELPESKMGNLPHECYTLFGYRPLTA